MEPFLNSGGAFRPQIVKVGALSAPTKEILLKYSLDLLYILEVIESLFVQPLLSIWAELKDMSILLEVHRV